MKSRRHKPVMELHPNPKMMENGLVAAFRETLRDCFECKFGRRDAGFVHYVETCPNEVLIGEIGDCGHNPKCTGCHNTKIRKIICRALGKAPRMEVVELENAEKRSRDEAENFFNHVKDECSIRTLGVIAKDHDARVAVSQLFNVCDKVISEAAPVHDGKDVQIERETINKFALRVVQAKAAVSAAGKELDLMEKGLKENGQG